MFGLSMMEVMVILVVALLVLGPDQLPKAAKTIGKTLRDVRRASDDLRDTFEREVMQDQKPPVIRRPEGAVAAVGTDPLPDAVLGANAPPKLPMSDVPAAPDVVTAPAPEPTPEPTLPTESTRLFGPAAVVPAPPVDAPPVAPPAVPAPPLAEAPLLPELPAFALGEDPFAAPTGPGGRRS